MSEPTPAMRKALEHLNGVLFATPAEIGIAMGGTKRGVPQGLGRIGGRMAKRLIAVGLAVDASRLRDGFPAYAITPAGSRALKPTGTAVEHLREQSREHANRASPRH